MTETPGKYSTAIVYDMSVHGARLAGVSRRGVLGAGGALAAVFAMRGRGAMAQAASALTRTQTRSAATVQGWIEIRADNTVLLRTGKCDFGQSTVYTAYRQIVAEELCVPLDAMTEVVSGDTDRTPDGGGTFGLLRYGQNGGVSLMRNVLCGQSVPIVGQISACKRLPLGQRGRAAKLVGLAVD